MKTAGKILITGSNGQVGTEFKALQAKYPGAGFIFFTRQELDIADEASVKKTLDRYQPDYLVNCAAYTAVDKAETERDKAMAINGTATGRLAHYCNSFNIRFVHISTDYVFNGNATAPLKETDPVEPVNYYGETKLAGERLAIEANKEAIIIRSSWVYSSYGYNFVKTMIRLMNEKDEIKVVNDQFGSPTYAADLAEAIMHIINSGKWVPGVYHYSNGGVISWFDFASEIKEHVKTNCLVQQIGTENYPTPAKRPRYSVLDKTKIVETFGLPILDWKERLALCIQKLNEQASFH